MPKLTLALPLSDWRSVELIAEFGSEQFPPPGATGSVAELLGTFPLIAITETAQPGVTLFGIVTTT